MLNARALNYRVVRAGRRTTFLINVARNAGGDDLPWMRGLADDLRRTGVPVVMYRVP